MIILKSKFLSVFLIVCIIAGISTTVSAVSGKGNKANPFRISTAEELLLLADFPDCYFELENDIELTETWTPIEDFSGTFDGKGHTITVKAYKAMEYCGFFGTLSGTVKNLTINANEITLTATTNANDNTGLIAGQCSGNITACKVKGKATFKADYSGETLYAGGICGELSGTISQSINLAEIILKPYNSSYYTYYVYYGGIAYKCTETGTITDSINLESSVTVSDYPSYVLYGGIAFYNYGNITNCCSAGGKDLTTSSKYGISKGGTMTNCYFDKNVFNYTSYSDAYGIPKSTLAMKMEATYENWDFDTIWAIDESEENPINNGYPYLRAFYEKGTYPVTASTISSVNGNLIIDCKIKDVSDSHTLHVAFYDADNKLCSYYIIPNDRELKDVFVVTKDDGKAEYAKIFTWSALNMIEPIAVSERIEIIR